MADDERAARAGPDGTDWASDPEILAAAFHGLPGGLYLTDRAGLIRAVNPQAARLLGRPAAALLGADAHALLHRAPDGSPPARERCGLPAVIEEGGTGRGDCATWLHGDGHLMAVDWTSAPIRRAGRVAGAAVLFSEATERVAAECRQAGYLAELERLTERMALVAEITTVLTQTLDVDEALRRLGRLLVPRLADWAAVDLWAGEEELRRTAVATPEGLTVQVGQLGPLPPVPESSRSTLARVLRGGEPVLLGPQEIAAFPDSPLAAAEHDLFRSLAAVSAIVAPLRTARQVLGALTVARTDPARPFDAAETALIADIARRAALAVDNARLFGQQRDIAATWQRYLLTPLPRAGGLELAARYLPAPEGSQVGGDWYDALQLADGSTALVIGDVSGHDLHAAACMAQLRNMLRALAWDRTGPPSTVVDRLDQAMTMTSEATMATMVLARVEGPEGGPWRLRFTNAGHPPPLLVTDGHASYLDRPHDMLMGTQLRQAAARPRRDGVEPLPPGSTLLLYTDGLVEAPGSGLDTGLARLRRNAAALAGRPLEEFCDELLERLPPGHTDDIALLAARLPR